MNETSNVNDFVVLMQLTPTAASSLRDTDTSVLQTLEDTAGAIMAAFEPAGEVLAFYITAGTIDVVAIIRVATNGDEMSFAAKMAATGLVTTSTMSAYSTKVAIERIGRK